MSDNRADVAKAAAELHRSVRGAAVRWNNRETRRWSEGEDDLEAGSLEFSVRAKSLGGIIDSAAFVRVFAPEGSLHFDVGLQFHLEGELDAADTVVAEFGRKFAAPLLLSHLRGAVSTECLVMGWDTIVLPPSLEEAVLDLSDDVIIGKAAS